MSILHPSNSVAERIVLVQFQAEMGKAEALGGAGMDADELILSPANFGWLFLGG